MVYVRVYVLCSSYPSQVPGLLNCTPVTQILYLSLSFLAVIIVRGLLQNLLTNVPLAVAISYRGTSVTFYENKGGRFHIRVLRKGAVNSQFHATYEYIIMVGLLNFGVLLGT